MLSSLLLIMFVYSILQAWVQSNNILARITFWLFMSYVIYQLLDVTIFNPVPEPLFGNPYK